MHCCCNTTGPPPLPAPSNSGAEPDRRLGTVVCSLQLLHSTVWTGVLTSLTSLTASPAARRTELMTRVETSMSWEVITGQTEDLEKVERPDWDCLLTGAV